MISQKQTLQLHPERLAVCRFDANAPVPDWATGTIVSITRTDEELCVVCPQVQVPEGIDAESPWRCFRVVGPLDFALIGVLQSLLEPLGAAGISVFVISTYLTDCVLVKEADSQRAEQALAEAGHTVVSVK